MSVKLHQRTESSLEFLNNAYKLRNLLIAKIKVDFKTSKERTEESKGRFENQPDWLIEDGRKCLINNLRQLTSNAIMGNNIYVVSEEDKNERRLYFTKAIGNCKIILQELYFLKSELGADIERYKMFIDIVSYEIKLLKGCRAITNKMKAGNS